MPRCDPSTSLDRRRLTTATQSRIARPNILLPVGYKVSYLIIGVVAWPIGSTFEKNRSEIMCKTTAFSLRFADRTDKYLKSDRMLLVRCKVFCDFTIQR